MDGVKELFDEDQEGGDRPGGRWALRWLLLGKKDGSSSFVERRVEVSVHGAQTTKTPTRPTKASGSLLQAGPGGDDDEEMEEDGGEEDMEFAGDDEEEEHGADDGDDEEEGDHGHAGDDGEGTMDQQQGESVDGQEEEV